MSGFRKHVHPHWLAAHRELMWHAQAMPRRDRAYRRLMRECCKAYDATLTGEPKYRGRRTRQAA